MKYILVIGAGENQVPIIKAAKKEGCFVYAVTPAGKYPGISLADEWIEKNIFDKDEIIEYFVKNNKPLDGVISDQSDMAAPIVAYIAEKMNLPTWGYDNAIYFTDKVKMREVFERVGLPVPKNKKINSLEEAFKAAGYIGLPVVFKPTNSFSSRGITLVRKQEEIENAYKCAYDNSRTHEVVVEAYIKGKQYFSQGLVSDYKLNMYAFSDRYYYDLPNVFIPYTNAFPAKIDKTFEKRLVNEFNKVINELKPRFGHVWAEWIFNDETDELYIVEMAIRGGGAHVTTDLIPLAYGVDSQTYLIHEALGENTHFYEFKGFTNKAAAFYSFLLPEGRILSIKGIDKIEKIPGVVSADIKEMNAGDMTVEIADKRSRYGLIVIAGESRDELDEIWNKLKSTIEIEVETREGIKGAIWE